MRKKAYIIPRMECVKTEAAFPLCVSNGVMGSGSVNAGYGGVDRQGTYQPSSVEYAEFEELVGEVIDN